MDSSSKRIKIAGAVVAAALLVVVGVVALNNTANEVPLMPLEHALARAENTKTPMSQLPEESAIITPKGWEIESDEPVAGAVEEEVDEDKDMAEESEAYDADIDSPVLVEQDQEGHKFVAEMEDDVLSDDDGEDEDDETEGMEVVEDAKKKKGLRCKNRRLKKCGSRKKCKNICRRRCKRVTRRRCKNRKFCRCFCKFRKNKKAARKCVVYKRKICGPVKVTLCKRRCRKFCKRVPHCYCCKGPRQVTTQCRRTCRRELRKTKCGNCRCAKVTCYKTCRLVCRK